MSNGGSGGSAFLKHLLNLIAVRNVFQDLGKNSVAPLQRQVVFSELQKFQRFKRCEVDSC